MEVTGFPLFSSSARLRDIVATIEPIPCHRIKTIVTITATLGHYQLEPLSFLETPLFKAQE